MKAFRIGLFPLTVVYAILALWGLLNVTLSDSEIWWQDVTLLAVQPFAAASLVVLVTAHQARLTNKALQLLSVMPAVAVCFNLFEAAAIVQGAISGDWWIPFAFALIPAIGLAYTATLGRGSRSAAIA